jgi:hypothetical protein
MPRDFRPLTVKFMDLNGFEKCLDFSKVFKEYLDLFANGTLEIVDIFLYY